ncbi:MAG TPA: Wzz/FepE/Etk N-terminal domain-containing protein [Terriglobia bacterium]|nr:Wzz/FepE/Etk N-terminal domain-containing protein [Terriglobia bacterium]
MAQTATKPQPEVAQQPVAGEVLPPEMFLDDSRDWQAEQLRVLWEGRRFFSRVGAIGLLVSTLIAFLIPKSYTSMAQLMPPDTQSSSGMAMMAALTARGGGFGSVAEDLLGLQSSGALFIGVLRSQTAQERLIQEFGLQKVYGKKLVTDARTELDENTSISEDRKSGIISISVTDHDPKRAAAIANGYVNQLNALVAELSTSAARRERVFLEQRLKVAKRDRDAASNQLALFSSKNNTLDIQTEGKAMLDAAGTLAGQMIAAQSELEGLRQIYTDNNPRVRALNARVGELRKQLEKLSGTGADAATTGDSSLAVSNGMPYPTIRSLPLLGARYSDYYSRAKIQETVFELLTEQYELAKIEEAKETPSVKVLDPGQVPERKSFPSRSLIIFEGTFVVLAISVVWLLGSNRWQAADPKDPRKVLAQEVAHALKARMPWASRNGYAPDSSEQRREDGLDSRRPPSSGSVDQ